MPSPKHGYLIYKSGRGYYCEGAKGYAFDQKDAGRFSLVDAIAYTHPNGPDGPRDGLDYWHESLLQDFNAKDEVCISELTRERDNLRAANETLSQELAAALARIETLTAEKHGMESAIDTISRAYS